LSNGSYSYAGEDDYRNYSSDYSNENYGEEHHGEDGNKSNSDKGENDEESKIDKSALNIKTAGKLSPRNMLIKTLTGSMNENDEYFICKVCSKVVLEPKECNKCGLIYCGDCL
jgi:rubrerythrin